MKDDSRPQTVADVMRESSEFAESSFYLFRIQICQACLSSRREKRRRVYTAYPGTGWTIALFLPLMIQPFGAASWTMALAAEALAITDRSITIALESKLTYDDTVDENSIDIDSAIGIVTLSGHVTNLLSKERAARHAETIKGVRAVIDRIEVRSRHRPDRELLFDVLATLKSNPVTDGYDIRPSVRGGVVTLSGRLGSWAEYDLAQRLVTGVRGVRAVRNRLVVEATGSRSKSEIAQAIVARIGRDVWIDSSGLEVRIEGGTSFLTGKVASAFGVFRARSLARVAGVRKVDVSGLQVDWTILSPGRRLAPPDNSNMAIKNAVLAALADDPRILARTVSVDVDHGRVVLSGRVGSLFAKQAATENARNTVGVFRVIDHLKVRPGVDHKDELVIENVRRALRRDPITDHFEIRVAVRDGIVILDGIVDHQAERRRASIVASRLKGVIAVRNRIELADHPVSSPDYAIRDDIKIQLRSNPYVRSERIEVEVESGVATLRGSVLSAVAFRHAEKSAHRGGARSVRNRLTIKGMNWRGRRTSGGSCIFLISAPQEAEHRAGRCDGLAHGRGFVRGHFVHNSARPARHPWSKCNPHPERS